MNNIQQLMVERISSGLKRKSVTSCSRWACAYRIMGGASFPGPWTFKYHPWLKEMHDSVAEMNIGQKSAQMGYTETALNVTFYNLDRGINCLYVLPSQRPDAQRFSAGRFDPALSLSPYLRKMFSDVNNTDHKRAGSTSLYITGSKSRSHLKSVDTGLIVGDEVEEFDQDNLPLMFERQSGQFYQQSWLISTPRMANTGINRYFNLSSKESFFFKCPHCSHLTTLIFPECLKIVGEDFNDPRIVESYIQCKECETKLDHETKWEWLKNGIWVPEHGDRMNYRGFYINQLFSSTVKVANIVKSFFLAQRNPADEQEFYNSKLGLDHVVAGAAVTDDDLEACKHTYKKILSPFQFSDNNLRPTGLITMGVDQGRWIHYEIDQWTLPRNRYTIDIHEEAVPKVLAEGKVENFEDLDKLIWYYNVLSTVVDAFPERRKGIELAGRHFKRVKLCFYAVGVQGKNIQIAKEEESTINVDRTSWLDLSLGRFKNKTIELPLDISTEYRDHIKALVRIYEKDKFGQDIGVYRNGNNADHFAHARNYAEIALQFALRLGVSQNISSIG